MKNNGQYKEEGRGKKKEKRKRSPHPSICAFFWGVRCPRLQPHPSSHLPFLPLPFLVLLRTPRAHHPPCDRAGDYLRARFLLSPNPARSSFRDFLPFSERSRKSVLGSCQSLNHNSCPCQSLPPTCIKSSPNMQDGILNTLTSSNTSSSTQYSRSKSEQQCKG